MFLSIEVTDILLAIIVILFFFCLFMFNQNKQLRNRLKNLRLENESLDRDNDKDIIPIKEISDDVKEDIVSEYLEKEEDILEDEEDDEEVIEVKKEYYSRNVLQKKKQVTSPISIDNNFDVNEFVKKDNKVVNNESYDYLKEVSDKLSNEVEAKTIELTEYEKKQEESAIISYKELLKVKDQIQTIDDEDETIEFIENLKNFRDNLE